MLAEGGSDAHPFAQAPPVNYTAPMAPPPASSRPIVGRATVLTLSRAAGVSPSTVSRALKADPRISLKTRERVAALAAEAGYMPDAVGRTLSGGRSGLIGFVLGDIGNPFYPELLQQTSRSAQLLGLRLLLVHVGAGPIDDTTAEALIQHRVDGALITSAELSSRAAAICAASNVPVVMVNRIPRLHASAVSCDNFAGGKDLADFLLRQGHRRFAVIRGTPGASTSEHREAGFTQAADMAGASIASRHEGRSSYEGGYESGAVIAALPRRRRPTAVFAVNDIMAMGAIDAFRLAGLSVPQDISIVGFDNIDAASRPIYRITTMSQPLEAMVERGLGMLLGRMARQEVPDEVLLLRGTLIERNSTRPV